MIAILGASCMRNIFAIAWFNSSCTQADISRISEQKSRILNYPKSGSITSFKMNRSRRRGRREKRKRVKGVRVADLGAGGNKIGC